MQGRVQSNRSNETKEKSGKQTKLIVNITESNHLIGQVKVAPVVHLVWCHVAMNDNDVIRNDGALGFQGHRNHGSRIGPGWRDCYDNDAKTTRLAK